MGHQFIVPRVIELVIWICLLRAYRELKDIGVCDAGMSGSEIEGTEMVLQS